MTLFKKVLLSSIVTLLAFGANAQFHLGVKAGANLSKIDGKPFKDQFEFNYLAGAFAEIGVGQRVSINPEVLFSQSSATVSDNYNDVTDVFKNDQRKAKLNYLSIPILLDVKLAGPLHIQVGPQFSAAISNDKTLLQNGQSAFKGGDFAMVGGIGINVSKVRITGRYVAGMNDISDVTDQGKWKNKSIQLAVGFAIF